MINHWVLNIILFIFTYISRIIGLEVMADREISPTMRLYFTYVPIAIISAIIVKQVLIPTEGQLEISLPVLLGCFFTAITIKKTKMFLPSVLIGAIIGLLARCYFN